MKNLVRLTVLFVLQFRPSVCKSREMWDYVTLYDSLPNLI